MPSELPICFRQRAMSMRRVRAFAGTFAVSASERGTDLVREDGMTSSKPFAGRVSQKLSAAGRVAVWIVSAITAAAFIYLCYGMFTQRGLVAFLIKLQLDAFGAAEIRVAI